MLLVLFLGAGNTALARTWYVLPDSTGDAPTIQAAIDSSADSDSVVVAAGTYYVNLQITGLSDFTLISESGPEVTILDGTPQQNPQRRQVVRILQSPNTLIEGFTIQKANPSLVSGWGGGLLISGGSRVTIRGNIIRENNNNDAGGGLAFQYPCEGCGGSVIEDNQFLDNTCPSHAAGIWIYGVGGENVLIQNNYFEGNAGGYAGIRTEYAAVRLVANVFVGNVSTGGCAVLLWGSVWVEGNILCLNEGGALGVASGEIVGNTVVFNTGGGINPSNSRAHHNISVGNDAGFGFADTSYCNNVWGNTEYDYGPGSDSCGINGNICVDPLFCDPESGDYSIAAESPCAPDNSGGCGLIGALDVGCVFTSVQQGRSEQTSWGTLKKIFR